MMDTKEVSDPRKIHRSKAKSDLHSPQCPVDEDEGYSSRLSSWVMSPSPSHTSLHPTTSSANIPSTIPGKNEDLEAISSGCADHKTPEVLNPPSGHSVQSSCAKKDSIESTAANIQVLPDSHHAGEHPPPSEEPEDLSSRIALLKLTESSAHQSVLKCSLCDLQIKSRRLSYQPPPLPPIVHYRRGSEATVFTKPLQPEKEPTCIMCRRNSQKTSPPPKRKLPSTKSYVFKATPTQRWNPEIIVSLKNI